VVLLSILPAVVIWTISTACDFKLSLIDVDESFMRKSTSMYGVAVLRVDEHTQNLPSNLPTALLYVLRSSRGSVTIRKGTTSGTEFVQLLRGIPRRCCANIEE
jgi:hypothetical protein